MKKITPLSRVEDHKDVLQEIDDKLYCKVCKVFVNHKKKSTLDDHLDSKKHKENVASQENQVSIKVYDPKYSNELIDLVLMMLCSNTPFYKLDIMKEVFFDKHMPDFIIPSKSLICSKIVPELYQKAQTFIKNKYENKLFVILCDETKDCKLRCVLNVFAYFVDYLNYILLNTIFPPDITHQTIVKCISDTLEIYNMKWINCLGIVGDNASNMLASAAFIKDLYGKEIVYVRCFSHILNLIFDVWKGNPLFSPIATFAENWKKMMKKVGGVKSRYKSFCMATTGEDIELMPEYVKTRWLSFFECILYMSQHYEVMCDFIQSEDYTGNKSEYRKKLTNIICSEKLFRIKIYYMNELSLEFSKYAKQFQEEESVAHLVYPAICNLFALFKSSIENNNLMKSFDQYAETNPESKSAIQATSSTVKDITKKAIEKLEMHLKHLELKEFIASAACFNPTFAISEKLSFEKFYLPLFTAKNLDKNLLEKEYLTYLSLIESKSFIISDINAFWKNQEKLLPTLSILARRTVNFPVANCAVERSFALYRCVLTDKRRKFLEENLKEYVFFYVNKDKMKEIFN